MGGPCPDRPSIQTRIVLCDPAVFSSKPGFPPVQRWCNARMWKKKNVRLQFFSESGKLGNTSFFLGNKFFLKSGGQPTVARGRKNFWGVFRRGAPENFFRLYFRREAPKFFSWGILSRKFPGENQFFHRENQFFSEIWEKQFFSSTVFFLKSKNKN